MLGKFLQKLTGTKPSDSSNGIRPYKSSEANAIYNLLFCDNAALYSARPDVSATDWQATLASSDSAAISALANDADAESRVRLLAFNRLRELGQQVPSGQVLGVVVEVPLKGGLDCLAAYSDGRVRYINQSEKIAIFEGGPASVADKAKELIAVAIWAVKAIGPWDKARLPSPKPGNIRLSFLVSDGLYFGEGPFAIMQREAMAAPTIKVATELLQLAVSAGVGA